MKSEQFTLITCDLKGSISIDFKKFSVEEIKDLIGDMDDSAVLTIRIPYNIEYGIIKDLYNSDCMTPEKIQRITLDFID